MTAGALIQLKRGKATTVDNPVLAVGEPWVELDNSGLPTGKMKVGDGVTHVNSLPYFTPGNGTFAPLTALANYEPVLTRRSPVAALVPTEQTAQNPTVQPFSVGVDGYVYAGATDGGNIVYRSNDGFATKESGQRFSGAALGDTGTVNFVTKTNEGWYAILVDATQSRIYFRPNATGWTATSGFTLVQTIGKTAHIGIGQPIPLTGGNTFATVGEYSANSGQANTAKLWLTTDGGQTWRSIRDHVTAAGGNAWNTHCHGAGLDTDTMRLWASFGDGPNCWFGYTDNWQVTTPTWVGVPANGVGPDDVASPTYNHPTLVIPMSNGVSLTPDGSVGRIGVWHLDKTTGKVSVDFEVAAVDAYRQWARGPFARSGDTAYVLFPPDSTLNLTDRYFIAGTGDGGATWHPLYGEKVNVATELPTYGIVGPDPQGRLYWNVKRNGTQHLYIAQQPTWTATDKASQPPAQVRIAKFAKANRPSQQYYQGFNFDADRKELSHSSGSEWADVGTPLDTNLRVAKRQGVRVAAQALSGENFPRDVAQGALGWTTGDWRAGLIGLLFGDVVTNILVHTTVTGTPTLVKAALLKSDGTVLASSADVASTWVAGSATGTPRKIPLSAPYTVPNDGTYYLSVLFAGGGMPTLIRGTSGLGITLGPDTGGSPGAALASSQADIGASHPLTANGTAVWFGWN